MWGIEYFTEKTIFSPPKLKGMKYFLFVLFLFAAFVAPAQSGFILLQVQPTNAIVRLNAVEYKNLTRVELPVGTYTIEAWAPGREYIKDRVEIYADAFVKYDTVLAISPAYKTFSQEMQAYSKAKNNNAILKGSIVAFNAGITALVVAFMPGDVRQHRNAANNALDNYNNTTGIKGLEQFRLEYEEEKQLYEAGKQQRKKYFRIALPSLVAMYGISVFAWTRIKKAPPKPVLNAPNPFSTMDLRLVPQFENGYAPTGMGFWFTMKF